MRDMLLIELEDRTLFLEESEIKSVVLSLNVDDGHSNIFHFVTIESAIGVKLFEISFNEMSSAKRAYKKFVKAMQGEDGIKLLNFKAYK